MSHPVHLADIYGAINSAAALFFAGVAAWAARAGAQFITAHLSFLGAQIDSEMRDSLNTALKNGARVALHALEEWEAQHQDVPVSSWLAEKAAQYAEEHAPAAMARFGLSPDDLARKALAYLPPIAPGATKEQTITAALNMAQLVR